MKDSRVYLIQIRDCINRIKQYTTGGEAAIRENLRGLGYGG
jgi:uncharacterized protein with HEPN domain